MAQQVELIEGRKIPELHEAAIDYVRKRDKRLRSLEDEVDSKRTVLELMKTHKKKTYICDGLKIEIIPGKDDVKVKELPAGKKPEE